MKRYVAKKGNRWYAIIYEGIDPVTGGNDEAGMPPAPSAPTPNGSRQRLPATANAETMRRGH
jgi:hypothetical protein